MLVFFPNCLDNLSLFENRPAYSEPRETIIAPVNVAKSTINSGLNFSKARSVCSNSFV